MIERTPRRAVARPVPCAPTRLILCAAARATARTSAALRYWSQGVSLRKDRATALIEDI
jgi:hypothetical protein